MTADSKTASRINLDGSCLKFNYNENVMTTKTKEERAMERQFGDFLMIDKNL